MLVSCGHGSPLMISPDEGGMGCRCVLDMLAHGITVSSCMMKWPLFRSLLSYNHSCRLYGRLAYMAPPVLSVVPYKPKTSYELNRRPKLDTTYPSSLTFMWLKTQPRIQQGNLGTFTVGTCERKISLKPCGMQKSISHSVVREEKIQNSIFWTSAVWKKGIVRKRLRKEWEESANGILHIKLIALSSWELPLDCPLRCNGG